MAKEKKTVNNADEQINKQLYNIAANIVERDNIDRLREKTRAISNRNTEHRDKNGMMDTLTQIMYNNKSHRTSSTNKISASTLIATEKASLIYIPDEYVLTGVSIKSPNSENSIILSTLSSISFFVKPKIEALKYIFSLPVKSG